MQDHVVILDLIFREPSYVFHVAVPMCVLSQYSGFIDTLSYKPEFLDK